MFDVQFLINLLLSLTPPGLAVLGAICACPMLLRAREQYRRKGRVPWLLLACTSLLPAGAALAEPMLEERILHLLIDRLEEREGADRMQAAMFVGGVAGARTDVPTVLTLVEEFPEPMDNWFMGGAAHELRLDISDPDELYQRLAMASERRQIYLHNAAIRNLVRSVDLEPDRAIPLAEHYAANAGVSATDALRTALQWTYAHNLPGAVELAATYPESYREALFEELGWRAGTHGPPGVALEGIPVAVRCAYLQGVYRGVTLNGTPDSLGERLQPWRKHTPEDCEVSAAYGIAWAMELTGSTSPPSLDADQARALDRGRTCLAAHLDELEGTWQIPANCPE